MDTKTISNGIELIEFLVKITDIEKRLDECERVKSRLPSLITDDELLIKLIGLFIELRSILRMDLLRLLNPLLILLNNKPYELIALLGKFFGKKKFEETDPAKKWSQGIITDFDLLEALLLQLPIGNRFEFCNYLYQKSPDRLLNSISNSKQLISLLILFKTGAHFNQVYSYFTMKAFDIIQNRWELLKLLKLFPIKQRFSICINFKVKLPQIIQDGSDLCLLLNMLLINERIDLIELFSEQLFTIVNSSTSLIRVLALLPPENRFQLIQHFNTGLISLIDDAYQLFRLIELIPSKHHTSLYTYFEKILPEIVWDSYAFFKLSDHFPHAHTSLYDAFKEKFVSMFVTEEGVLKLFILFPKQRTTLYDNFKKELKNIIITKEGVLKFFELIPSEYRVGLYAYLIENKVKPLAEVLKKGGETFDNLVKLIPVESHSTAPTQEQQTINKLKLV